MQQADGFGLQQKLNQVLALNDEAIDEQRKSGEEFARAQYDYRRALALRMAQMRADGLPASMCKDMARGDDEVARCEMRMAMAEAAHDADKEVVMLRKREADVLREQMQREWSNAGRSWS